MVADREKKRKSHALNVALLSAFSITEAEIQIHTTVIKLGRRKGIAED